MHQKKVKQIVKIPSINSNQSTLPDELYEYPQERREETTSICEGIHKDKNNRVTRRQRESHDPRDIIWYERLIEEPSLCADG